MEKGEFTADEEPYLHTQEKGSRTKRHRGFIESKNGSKYYEDVFESVCGYYDSNLQRMIETMVGTDGVDEFGDTELQGSKSVRGFSTMIAKFDSATGEPLPDSEGTFIDIRPENFPDQKVGVREMRLLVQQVHDYAMKHPQEKVAELVRGIEAMLGSKSGWRKHLPPGRDART